MMDFYKYLFDLKPNFRKDQLRHSVYVDLIDDLENATTFSKINREIMKESFDLIPFAVQEEVLNNDGSIKWLLKLKDDNLIETVLLQFRDGRKTVCVSSQVGCPMGCAFCATGKLGLKRNLTSWEIVGQVLLAARYLKRNSDRLSNIVFMGMGEPLANLDNVLFAIEELTSPNGFGIGARHVTVSTCGKIPELKKFIEAETRTTLAVSLHAPTQKLREELMPIAKANPLDRLMNVLDEYVGKTGRRVTYEYVMLAGVNDSKENAGELVKLLRGRLAHVNLITFNSIAGAVFTSSSKEKIESFKKVLIDHNIAVTLRVSLGDEIAAACGQLAGRDSSKYKV